jgi:hypothetical protein
MEVCSSTEMGAPGASHLGTGDREPKTDRSRLRSVPVNALVGNEVMHRRRWRCNAPRISRASTLVVARLLSFVATLERVKDGSELVSATEAMTWIEFACT